MNKLLICLIVLLTVFLSVGMVAADDNATVADNDADVPAVDDVPTTGNDTGTEPVENESGEPEVEVLNSTMTASKVTGYTTFSTKFTVSLKANDTALAARSVNITIDGKTYVKTTDNDGQASVSLKLPLGTYDVSFAYAGDENTTSASGTSQITIKQAIKTKLQVADKDINYRQGLKNAFIVRLLDANGKAIANQVVTFKVSGKTYTAKTDSKGYAEVYLKSVKKGTRTVKFSFSKTSPYLSSSGSYKIKVKAAMAKGNGYWLWSSHMKSVSLKKLSKLGTKHIFLHVHAIAVYGKSSVVSFIKTAHKYKMKVHLWIQVCYSGGKWVRPVNKDGSYKYSFMNKKIKEAKKYAKIKGVDGIHLDYIRFGGTAHLYKTSTKAINYMVKKISIGIHKIKPNCIVSAAVMPEPSMMHYYYGQDIPTMGKYLDVIVPMVYKGNYGQKTTWITKVCKEFKTQSKSAVIWGGIQTYKSDDNPKKLSSSALLKDAKATIAGGATGAMLFRIGITHLLNFKKL